MRWLGERAEEEPAGPELRPRTATTRVCCENAAARVFGGPDAGVGDRSEQRLPVGQYACSARVPNAIAWQQRLCSRAGDRAAIVSFPVAQAGSSRTAFGAGGHNGGNHTPCHPSRRSSLSAGPRALRPARGSLGEFRTLRTVARDGRRQSTDCRLRRGATLDAVWWRDAAALDQADDPLGRPVGQGVSAMSRTGICRRRRGVPQPGVLHRLPHTRRQRCRGCFHRHFGTGGPVAEASMEERGTRGDGGSRGSQ